MTSVALLIAAGALIGCEEKKPATPAPKTPATTPAPAPAPRTPAPAAG